MLSCFEKIPEPPRALAELNRKNADTGKPALNARIGIETGPVVVDAAVEFYGDAPNVAARVSLWQRRAPPRLNVRCLRRRVAGDARSPLLSRGHPLNLNPIYFFPHFVSRMSPIVPPEIVSPSTGLPRKMILVFSWYSFWPNLFQALHGASMRHSLNVLAVQVKVCLGPPRLSWERQLQSTTATQAAR